MVFESRDERTVSVCEEDAVLQGKAIEWRAGVVKER